APKQQAVQRHAMPARERQEERYGRRRRGRFIEPGRQRPVRHIEGPRELALVAVVFLLDEQEQPLADVASGVLVVQRALGHCPGTLPFRLEIKRAVVGLARRGRPEYRPGWYCVSPIG